MRPLSCISFESYIKPQLGLEKDRQRTVVYLLNPTSNHNQSALFAAQRSVVYLLTPTSNHNALPYSSYLCMLYIFWLLHQTTTLSDMRLSLSRCISFDSYIKPQPPAHHPSYARVVYLLTPTSNHNLTPAVVLPSVLYIFWLLHQTTTYKWCFWIHFSCISFDSYIKPQHIASQLVRMIVVYPYIKPQLCPSNTFFPAVVYLLTPTSNHNLSASTEQVPTLYIFWLLHQTTTIPLQRVQSLGCISFDSYIKPQLAGHLQPYYAVVYLLTPTSNHNLLESTEQVPTLYIFWLLHQTTTARKCK